MKKFVVLSVVVLLVALSSAWVTRTAKSAGPPSCHAGDPPNNTNCTDCHDDGIANSGTAQVFFDLDGAENGYLPGKTYTITVTVSNPGMQRAGFQCIALQDQDNRISPGLVTLTDPDRTQILDKDTPHAGGCLEEERVWIEHTYNGNSSNASGVSSWSYQWQAPADQVGPISFYLAALEANNDLAETGDQVYTRKKTITSLPTGIYKVHPTGSFVVYPLPATDEFTILVNDQVPHQITLYTSAGTPVKVWQQEEITAGNRVIKLSIKEVPPGIYLLCLQTGAGPVIQKITVF